MLGAGDSLCSHTGLFNQLSRHNGRARNGNMRRIPGNQLVTILACALDTREAPTAAALYPRQLFNRRPFHEPMEVTSNCRQVRRPRREGGRAKAPGEVDQLVDRDRACCVLGFVWHCRLFLAATSGKAATRAALSSKRTDQRSRLHPAGWRTEPRYQP